MVRKYLTNKEFVGRVNKLTNGEYTFINSYKGSSFKLKVKHNLCGTVFKCSPNRFVNQGQRCPNRVLDNLIVKCLYNQFEILSDYKGYDSKMLFKCIKHGKYFKTTPTSIVDRGRRYFCSDCTYKAQSENQLISTEEAKNKLKNKGIDYILCDKYLGVHNNNVFKCPTCGKNFIAEFNS